MKAKFKVGQKVRVGERFYIGLSSDVGVVVEVVVGTGDQACAYDVEVPVIYEPKTDILFYFESDLEEI